MMIPTSIIYLCNAIDEDTKQIRAITTDSPAATKKIFGLCRALLLCRMETIILSMGRGRQNGSGVFFSSKMKKVAGVQVYFADFWHIPLLTHLVTMFSLPIILRRIVKKGAPAILVYNRCWHYLPALVFAKLFQVRCFLDLEDGWPGEQKLSQRILTILFNWICNSGSLLACEALACQVKTQNNLVCYGVAPPFSFPKKKWQDSKLQIVFGGSLCEGTGVKLFIQAIKIFTKKYQDFIDTLHIVVVGFGDMTREIEYFSANQATDIVEFRGTVSGGTYDQLLADSHIGLCLKLVSGPFHNSTFPSKVIELSSHGLLLISTPVSDVPKIFSANEALLLTDDSPEILADAFFWAVKHRDNIKCMAQNGHNAVLRHCSLESVGKELICFFGSNSTPGQ